MDTEQVKARKTILWGSLIVSQVPALFMLLRWLILSGEKLPTKTVMGDYLATSLFSFTVSLSIFLSYHLLINRMVRRLSGKVSEPIRITVCLTYALLISNALIFIIWKIFNALFFHNYGPSERQIIFDNQVLVSVIVVIVSLVFEVKRYIEQLKIHIAEKERLEKEQARSQLEALRTQVSPHFLFNSFNALQSLIDIDSKKAKQFLQELAKVYRYSLENKNDLVVELKEELNFIQSYIYLNKIRFGENLQYDCVVNAESLKKFVPPLTLQLLVENAIKHNIISGEKPLKISIRVENGTLSVENNLQLRTEKLVSTGIGLENLRNRYQLIYHLEPEFITTDRSYIAKIPLIEKEANG